MASSQITSATSLTFIGGNEPRLSIVLDGGAHWFIRLRPAQVALLSQECAAYTSEQVRRNLEKPIS